MEELHLNIKDKVKRQQIVNFLRTPNRETVKGVLTTFTYEEYLGYVGDNDVLYGFIKDKYYDAFDETMVEVYYLAITKGYVRIQDIEGITSNDCWLPQRMEHLLHSLLNQTPLSKDYIDQYFSNYYTMAIPGTIQYNIYYLEQARFYVLRGYTVPEVAMTLPDDVTLDELVGLKKYVFMAIYTQQRLGGHKENEEILGKIETTLDKLVADFIKN